MTMAEFVVAGGRATPLRLTSLTSFVQRSCGPLVLRREGRWFGHHGNPRRVRFANLRISRALGSPRRRSRVGGAGLGSQPSLAGCRPVRRGYGSGRSSAALPPCAPIRLSGEASKCSGRGPSMGLASADETIPTTHGLHASVDEMMNLLVNPPRDGLMPWSERLIVDLCNSHQPPVSRVIFVSCWCRHGRSWNPAAHVPSHDPGLSGQPASHTRCPCTQPSCRLAAHPSMPGPDRLATRRTPRAHRARRAHTDTDR